jgi:hypothetical protein
MLEYKTEVRLMISQSRGNFVIHPPMECDLANSSVSLMGKGFVSE